MASTYAIVYATESKAHRRTIADDDRAVSLGTMPGGATPAVICEHPGRDPSYYPLSDGESALIEVVPETGVSASSYADWCDAIERATGTRPPIVVCAVIKDSTVVGVIHADPKIDAPPEGFLFVELYSQDIFVGCRYDPAPGLFFRPSVTIPPMMPGNSSSEPLVIPETEIPKP